MTWRLAAACAAAAVLAWLPMRLAAAPPEEVGVPSLDRRGDGPISLPGFWFRAEGVAPGVRAPAVVLLHGCGGPYDGPGQLSRRMHEYAALVNALGAHALVTDSLTPRGERELCTQRNGERAITQTQRRRDALGALQWLAAQPDVDASRLGLIGWSNGGSTCSQPFSGDRRKSVPAQSSPRSPWPSTRAAPTRCGGAGSPPRRC